MKTDDLIDCLVAEVPAMRRGWIEAWLMVALAASGIAALAGLTVTLGFRPDLIQALGGPTFWLKAAYTVAVALGGFWLLSRAGRPGQGVVAPLILLGLTLLVAILAGGMQWMQAAPDTRADTLMGSSATVCPTNIAGLALLAAPLVLLAARRFAPTRPGLAGVAAGLLIGGVAATVYGLHCPERTATFVAVWYSLGMVIPALIGGLIGRLIWRW